MNPTEAKLLERLAQLEQRLADKPAPPAPAFDHADPIGSLSKMGADVQYLTKLLVANAMGEQAPPELRALAHMGPQVAATRALEAKLNDLSRQVTDVVTSSSKKAARESFKAVTSDKSKYPALSKALAADPEFFDEDFERHTGSAEEFATRMEARLAKLGLVPTPPASDVNADADEPPSDSTLGTPQIEYADEPVDDDQSTQVESAPPKAAAPPVRRAPVNSAMPPLNQPKAGVFTPEDHAKLAQDIVRKYSGRQ
jgi:hypothetical protein